MHVVAKNSEITLLCPVLFRLGTPCEPCAQFHLELSVMLELLAPRPASSCRPPRCVRYRRPLVNPGPSFLIAAISLDSSSVLTRRSETVTVLAYSEVFLFMP